jgi:lipopolysaccharide transport system ATP-binding protein
MAGNTAIRCEGIGKQFKLGSGSRGYQTAREALRSIFTGAFRAKNAQTFWALRDVSFDIPQGQAFGIVGRNGAGKSTLLRILSRTTAPSEGRVTVHGRVGSLLEVGTGFHPELTGRENVFLNGAILGMSRAEVTARFDAIVAFAETERFLDTPVKHYSSGMYMRLAFAVAAHLDTEILLVDEVLAVGDVEFQKKCLGRMRNIADQLGRTVVFVSHNIGAIRSMCQSVVWLDGGRVKSMGPTNDQLEAYLASFRDTSSASGITRLDQPRNGGLGERFRFVSAEINEGRPAQHGEPVTLRLEVQVEGEVHEVAVGVGICSAEGLRLASADSDIRGVRWGSVAKGSACISLKFDELLLQPGSYVLDLAARSGEGHALDYIPSCLPLEVRPGPRTPNVFIREQAEIRIPASWELVQK